MLLILGIFMAILPYSGFPYSWKEVIFSLTGLGIVYLSYVMYKESKSGEKEEAQFDTFLENRDFSEGN